MENHNTDNEPSASAVINESNTETCIGNAKETNLAASKDTRPRKLTEKGQNYQVEISRKRFSSARTRIDRQCTLLSQLLETSNTEAVNQELVNLDRLFGEAIEHHDKLMNILPVEEQLEQQDSYEFADSQVFEMKHLACQWMKQQESNYGGRSRSKASSQAGSRASSRASSHRSKTIMKSKNSNISKASSKVISLKKEEDMLQKVQQARKEELDCMVRSETAKMEAESARLQQRLMKAKLEEEAERGDIEIDTTARFVKVASKETHQLSTSHQPLLPAPRAPPLEKSKPRAPQDSDMVDLMMKLVNLHTAPDVDLDVFRGDPLEYEYFRAAFKEVGEKKVTDSRGRLIRMLQYTSEDPKELIKSCLNEKEEGCFEKAISLLGMECT